MIFTDWLHNNNLRELADHSFCGAKSFHFLCSTCQSHVLLTLITNRPNILYHIPIMIVIVVKRTGISDSFGILSVNDIYVLCAMP